MPNDKTIIVQQKYSDYGKVVIDIKEHMDRLQVTRNNLASRTGISYSVIDRYYRHGDDVMKIDTDVIAKICYCLDLDIADVIRYQKPSK